MKKVEIPFETFLDLENHATTAKTLIGSISIIANDQLEQMTEDENVKAEYVGRAQAMISWLHELEAKIQEAAELIEEISS